jgi:hypothetical protein
MKEQTEKQFPTIACCGIDCGLCPRFYTVGKSKCPGCMGVKFNEKHPSCPIITCCFKKKGLETCAECEEFPCDRMKIWDKADSFVTHKKTLSNLRLIKEIGIKIFIKQQNKRITLLNTLVKMYDDGRSKSYYCLATAIMELEDLEKAFNEIKKINITVIEKKQIAIHTRQIFDHLAQVKNVKLIYRKEKA